MKSLEERLAFRSKQRSNEDKERSKSPVQAAATGSSMSAEPATAENTSAQAGLESTGNSTAVQGAQGYLNANAGDVIAKINKDQLTDEHLAELERTETAGKARSSVLNAISQARTKLKAGGAGWGGNA